MIHFPQKTNPIFSGFYFGLIYFLFGSVLFTVLVHVFRSIFGPEPYWLGLTVFITLSGCMVGFIPAGFGGAVLGWLIQRQNRNGSLTVGNATRLGILLGGLAAVLTLGIGLFIDLDAQSHGVLWQDIQHGSFLDKLPGYIRYDIGFIQHWIPEILIGLAIACGAGGLTGRKLAERVLG